MSKFESHEEYDRWRSQRALERQGARDMEELDAERPVYMAETKSAGICLLGNLVFAAAGIVSVLSFTASGREYLGRIVAFLS